MKMLMVFLMVIIANNLLHAQTRITGGYTINITEAPWQVLLTRNGEPWCGGIIVAPNFILTAHHCLALPTSPLAYAPVSSVKIIAGITCKGEINSSNTFDVSQFIVHPDIMVDVALLRLSNNITYNVNRRPINYWASADNTLYNIGNSVRVSGWGLTTQSDFNSMPDCLHAVDLNIISNQDVPNELDVFEHELAATGIGDIRLGGCRHDSGGPLTTLTAINEPVLIGVVRGGVGDCSGDNQSSPSIFVRVSHIRDWIDSVICTTNFTNQIVTTNTTINACGTGAINVNNVTVTPTGTLNINARGAVNIGPDFTVQSGAGFNINIVP